MKKFATFLLLVGGILVVAGIVAAVTLGEAQLLVVLMLLISGGVLEAAGVGLYFCCVVSETSPEYVPEGEVLYGDRLVTLSNREICFHHYHLNGATKCVDLASLDKIVAKKPNIWNGKWRIWGSSNLRTWFPCDIKRPSRDTIFATVPRRGGHPIGFTVEDSARFRQSIQGIGLLPDDTAARHRDL